jgi:4'-phosphopantetheinyl transferase
MVVMAICMVEIGVDVESIRPRKNILGIAERFFTLDEYSVLKKSKELYRDFFTLWTLKESQVKKTSDGIAKGLMTATFDFDENGWKTCDKQYLFETFYLSDYVLSICTSKSEIHSSVNIFEISANLQINAVNI